MKIFITYGDENFKKQRENAIKLAKKNGNFDKTILYLPSDIDKEFYEKNKNILSQKRGGGYWLWKPYFIVKTLEKMKEGDYLFYSDAGAFFRKNVDLLINELKSVNQDIMGFQLPLIELQWTKTELFKNMNCMDEFYKESNQMLASYILIKKTEFSLAFFEEFLEFACNEINITDKNEINIFQDENFIEHRHDQSIFSLLYKKYKLVPFKDPTQFGKHFDAYSGLSQSLKFDIGKLYFLENKRLYRVNKVKGNYEKIIFRSRNDKHLKKIIKYNIKIILNSLKLYKKPIY
ncbi:hypothetical protein [Fusobacterium varium]